MRYSRNTGRDGDGASTEPALLGAVRRRFRLRDLVFLGGASCFMVAGVVQSQAIISADRIKSSKPALHAVTQDPDEPQVPFPAFARLPVKDRITAEPAGFMARVAEKLPAIHFGAKTNDRAKAVNCLALAAWYEAGNNAEDQKSVMLVVLNRLRHPSFPKSVCGVVFQGSERTTGCQFTFTCDGSLDRRSPSRHAWERARQRAQAVLAGGVTDDVFEATHYHADYVNPWWSGKLEKLTKIGAHIFYRWRGTRGDLSNQPRLAHETVDLKFEALGRGGGVTPRDGSAGQTNTAGPSQLAGSVVAGPSIPPSSARFLVVDGGQPSGRWAVNALSECAGKTDCQVIAYASADDVDRNRRRAASARDRPVFLFVRDGGSGMAVALWDCEKISRPDPGQCLPAAGPGLQRLMRERSA